MLNWENIFQKYQVKKIWNCKAISKCRMWTKNHLREWEIWFKQKNGLEWTMNGLKKPFRKKNQSEKSKRNSKNQSEMAACEQKTTSEKANFCSNTFFSLYIKFRAKKFHAAKTLASLLPFLFRCDQNHYSNLTSKIMKICEQMLKKRQRLNTIQILWVVKKKCT